ncbi:NifU family protein [Candidatus Liberibacter americanus]|uniref:Thioredoxin-like protein n=1 Tax=Candidatus Liberibacter americanus str. Sao Paulo TaxID=1261131 RepID=U6B6R6_9HYPH|nr:NifU family protein [Candidatus Liberibacter americanus]AHA27442.1 Thioredoxin-like protein [Candidatus Liberibacter americanus str. Sao Paulo]EMS36715.1 nitrogen fixation protein [Candidatus Liberibacter americanus PW_SP]
MFIQTESTPNPDTMKFIPGRVVLERGTVHFSNAEEALISPLASRIFEISGVSSVYLGYDFITVAKNTCDWDQLKPPILGVIMEHFISDSPVISDGCFDWNDSSNESYECDSNIINKIKDVLDKRVRPAVARDGGDIVFKGYREGTVFLRMQGSCSGCPSATDTLKYGVMNIMNHFVPEVNDIRLV